MDLDTGIHERIPLAGLSKLPSVPQIAKVKTDTERRWLPLLGQVWPLGWGRRLVLGGLCPWGGEGHCPLGPLTAWMRLGGAVGGCPPFLYTLPISSSLLRLIREQDKPPSSQLVQETREMERQGWRIEEEGGEGATGATSQPRTVGLRDDRAVD